MNQQDRHSQKIGAMLHHALVEGGLSTCQRRGVGAIGVDRNGYIIGTGRNGNPAGGEHCNERICSSIGSKSGTDLNGCDAIHAEQNLIAHLRTSPQELDVVYLTVSPCSSCVDLLLATSCQTIVFLEQYPHEDSKKKWERNGRTWIHWSIGG